MGLCEGQYGPGGWGVSAVAVVVVVCVGRHAGLIPGFTFSLKLGPWLSLPEVAAGGLQCCKAQRCVGVVSVL